MWSVTLYIYVDGVSAKCDWLQHGVREEGAEGGGYHGYRDQGESVGRIEGTLREVHRRR